MLCCLAFGLAMPLPAHAGDAFYGTFAPNMSHPPAQLAAEMDAQAATGAGVLREHLHWDRIERAPNVFDFTDSDALVAATSSRGMTLLPVLIDPPSFYSSQPPGTTPGGWPPKDPAAITRFATELARRYGTRGTYWGCLLPGVLCRRPYRPITAWQVWNEPDYPSWWKTGVDAGAYTALLSRAYAGLKAGDASAEVVLGGLTNRVFDSPSYLEQLYDRGAAAYFDTLAIHPYAASVSGVVAVIQRARAIADAKGDAGVPIRVTEYGFATGGVREWVVDERCQAALIHATTQTLSARRTELGLRSIVDFEWQDQTSLTTGTWPQYAGLVRYDGSAKPALAAFTDAVAGRALPAGSNVNDVCPLANRG